MEQTDHLRKVMDLGFAVGMGQLQLTPDAGMMRVVCSWCGRDMGQKMGPTGMVTHGICKGCVEIVEARNDQKKMLAYIAKVMQKITWMDWEVCVDFADAAMEALDDLELLHGTKQTSVEEGRAIVSALKARGPLAVELVEAGE